MLDSYDPEAPEKHERWASEHRAIWAKPFRSPADHAREKALTGAMREAVSAEYADPDSYVRWQLSLTIWEADRLGIWAWLPRMPHDACVDDCRAAIAEVHGYVETVKHRRETFAVCRRAGMKPEYLRPLPKLTWATRWAMLRFRLGRARRCRRYQPREGS